MPRCAPRKASRAKTIRPFWTRAWLSSILSSPHSKVWAPGWRYWYSSSAPALGLLSRPGLVFDKLGLMLAAVRQALAEHPQVVVAVELRDPELLGPALVDTLKAHGATFCLGLHGKMPPIEEQLPILRALWPGPLVCRWNLNRSFGAYGYADAQKSTSPFAKSAAKTSTPTVAGPHRQGNHRRRAARFCDHQQ